jgi:hypothetical protein
VQCPQKKLGAFLKLDIKVNTVKVQNLRRDFENMKMKDNESIDSFMTQVMNVVN